MNRENNMPSGRASRKTCWLLMLWIVFAIVAGAAGQSSLAPEGATAFDLKEISLFDAPENARRNFDYIVLCPCISEPGKGIQGYPALKSDKPLYGSFQVGGVQGEPDSGLHYALVIDESSGTGTGYDRMYIDRNLNKDLADELPIQPAKNLPDSAQIQISSITDQVCFEPITVQITSEGGSGYQLEMMPRFFAIGTERPYAALAPAKLHMGTMSVGADKLDVVLGPGRGVPGPLDHPDTSLFFLLPSDEQGDSPLARWCGGKTLKGMNRYAGKFYRISATPSGDKLFVGPYEGLMGTLEFKPGSRDVKELSASGSLASRDAALNLAEGLTGESKSGTSSYSLPVGDYQPMLLSIKYDDLQCLILANSHADGLPGGRSEVGPPVRGIKIREDKPFVLDFSGEPQVIFASPAKGYRVALGGQLDVKAVLTDPSLDVMFRQIKEKDRLDPKVTITRSDGEVVAEGTMPFG